jgi:hypothetical protein
MTDEQRHEKLVRDNWKRGLPVPDSLLESAGFSAKHRAKSLLYGSQIGLLSPYEGLHGTGWTRVESYDGHIATIVYWVKGTGTNKRRLYRVGR